MSFFRLASYHPRAIPGDVVCVNLFMPQSRPTPNLKVTLGHEVAARLGVRSGDRLDLMWGRDEDAGSVLLGKASGRGGVKMKETGNSDSGTLYASFGHMPTGGITGLEGANWLLQLRVQPTRRLPPAYVDAGVVIKLPEDWWQVVPAGCTIAPEPPKAAKVAAPPPPPPPPPEPAPPPPPVRQPEPAVMTRAASEAKVSAYGDCGSEHGCRDVMRCARLGECPHKRSTNPVVVVKAAAAPPPPPEEEGEEWMDLKDYCDDRVIHWSVVATARRSASIPARAFTADGRINATLADRHAVRNVSDVIFGFVADPWNLTSDEKILLKDAQSTCEKPARETIKAMAAVPMPRARAV